jgi:hypothetical protein
MLYQSIYYRIINVTVIVVHGDFRKKKGVRGDEDAGILLRPLLSHWTGNLESF